MRRFFADTSSDNIIISGQDAHHITDVLRLKEGEKIICCGGDGYDCVTVLTSISNTAVCGNVLEKLPSTAEPPVKVRLFQGLPKGDKFEYIIQKTVELGITEIVPVETKRSVVKIPPAKAKSKTERWNKIAESAAKQSGRGLIPKVTEPIDFKKVLDIFADCDLPIVAYELENETSLKEALLKNSLAKTVNIFIGPEGGIDDSEFTHLKNIGGISVTLGPRILRTETAPLAVLSNIIYQLEDR